MLECWKHHLVKHRGITVRHHTKDKGDEGLGQVIADLMTNGIQVAVPLSEHLPFDLIAIGEHGAMRRVQVRYRASSDASLFRCELVGSGADPNGTHKRAFDVSISHRCLCYLLSVSENVCIPARGRVTVDWCLPSFIEGEKRSDQAVAAHLKAASCGQSKAAS